MISRNPEDYTLTTHAVDRGKTRKIDRFLIAETIENGEVKPATGANNYRLEHEFWFVDVPMRVVVDTKSMEIVTVEWKKQHD